MNPHRLRAIALSEWRGHPEKSLAVSVPPGISMTVHKVMAQLGLKDRLKEEEVLAAWGDTVGEFVAKHSTPKRLKNGILFVAVLQPTVRYELDRIWKRDILEKLKIRFGARTVKDIRFGL